MFPVTSRFLLAEDSAPIINLLADILIDFGFKNFVKVGNGLDAWTKMEEAFDQDLPFDVIISDITMPGLSGLQLLEKTRNHGHYRGVPFIVITTNTDRTTVLKAVVNGVSSYLVKPFTKNDLLARLKEAYEKTQKNVNSRSAQ